MSRKDPRRVNLYHALTQEEHDALVEERQRPVTDDRESRDTFRPAVPDLSDDWFGYVARDVRKATPWP